MPAKQRSTRNTSGWRHWWRPLALSIIAHGMIFAVFYLVFLSYFVSLLRQQLSLEYPVQIVYIDKQRQQTNTPPEKSGEDVLLPAALKQKIARQFAALSQSRAQSMLAQTRKYANNFADKLQRLQKIAQTHERTVSTHGQQEILDLLGQKFKSQDFVPATSPPKGEFIWDDFTIYHIEKLTTGYRITFVDRAGRVTVKDYYGAESRQFDTIYQVFRICGRSKLLKNLLNYTLKTVPTLLNEKS